MDVSHLVYKLSILPISFLRDTVNLAAHFVEQFMGSIRLAVFSDHFRQDYARFPAINSYQVVEQDFRVPFPPVTSPWVGGVKPK